MILDEIKAKIAEKKNVLAESFKVKSIGVFGSAANGEFTAESDVDILVEFFETPDIFEFIRLEEFLTALLGKKVDLATKEALKPALKGKILKETIFV